MGNAFIYCMACIAGLLHVEEGNYKGTSVTSKVTVQLEGCPVKALPVQSGLRHLRLQSPPLSFHLSEKQLNMWMQTVQYNQLRLFCTQCQLREHFLSEMGCLRLCALWQCFWSKVEFILHKWQFPTTSLKITWSKVSLQHKSKWSNTTWHNSHSKRTHVLSLNWKVGW